MANFTQHFVDAGRNYSECAKLVSQKIKLRRANQPSVIQSEQIIRFGIASEWTRRAATMISIDYKRRISGSTVNRSKKRHPTITEVIRFTMAWYAMNAIFSRNSILHMLGSPATGGELGKFTFLYQKAGLTNASVASLSSCLHKILDAPHVTRIATYPQGTSFTALEAIFRKYTPREFQTTRAGKEVRNALTAKNVAALNIPILIYLMRNWIVHASIMDGAFGSTGGFKSYMDTILQALALIHVGISREILKKL